jgi:hypothetical protein
MFTIGMSGALAIPCVHHFCFEKLYERLTNTCGNGTTRPTHALVISCIHIIGIIVPRCMVGSQRVARQL